MPRTTPEDDDGPRAQGGAPATPGPADEAAAPAPAEEGSGPSAPGLEEQLGEMKDRWLRAKADVENVRRRARLDVEDARRYGSGELLKELLPVLDCLQRALASAREAADQAMMDGLALTEQMFLAVLEGHGVTPVATAPGEPLDPSVHRAVVEQPVGGVDPGTIVAELVPGYRLHERLLREAQVVVARAPAEGEQGAAPPMAPEES